MGDSMQKPSAARLSPSIYLEYFDKVFKKAINSCGMEWTTIPDYVPVETRPPATVTRSATIWWFALHVKDMGKEMEEAAISRSDGW